MPVDEIRKKVRALIKTQGIHRASEALGLSANATLRIAANSRVQQGTLALAEQKLARLNETGRH